MKCLKFDKDLNTSPLRYWLFSIRDTITWYGRRPWHMLFGHGMCQKFLEEEKDYARIEIWNHDCCQCGLGIDRIEGKPTV